MAEFETNLRWLSERGNPVGAEELLERIEAEMAGDPLVVVAKRREGTIMTKTQQSPTTNQPKRYRGPALGVAAFVAILAVGALYLAFADDTDEVADNPPPTTVAPDVETMTDLEVIEAGVAALYSGDAEHAVELFELPAPMEDAWIRREARYQAAIDGRLTLDCDEQATSGVFHCIVPYGNVFTDAIGWVDTPDDTVRFVVEDGVIADIGSVCQPIPSFTCGPDGIAINIIGGGRKSGFPVHYFIDEALAGYLIETGYDGNPDCVQRSDNPIPNTPPSIECLQIVLNDLGGWAAWAETNLFGYADTYGVSLCARPRAQGIKCVWSD